MFFSISRSVLIFDLNFARSLNFIAKFMHFIVIVICFIVHYIIVSIELYKTLLRCCCRRREKTKCSLATRCVPVYQQFLKCSNVVPFRTISEITYCKFTAENSTSRLFQPKFWDVFFYNSALTSPMLEFQ